GDNTIVVKAVDYGTDVYLPRGKQFWEEKSRAIWYTRTTGIWQTVWAEAVSPVYVDNVMYTPDIDRKEIQIRSFIQGELADQDVKLQIKITYKGKLVAEDAVKVTGAEVRRSIRMENLNEHGMDYLWWPERPNLFDVEFTLFQDGQEADHVSSYFGMRKVSVENGKFNLNNRPY